MRGLPRTLTFVLALEACGFASGDAPAQDADAGSVREGTASEKVPPAPLSALEGQFWVLDLEPIALRLIASPPASTPPQARWIKELQPEAVRGAGEGGVEKGRKAPEERASVAARDSARVYWYLVYTVSNAGTEDREAHLGISATVDGRQVYSDLYLPEIEKAVEKKEREPLWGKVDQMEVLAKRDPKDPRYHYFTFKAGEKRKCVAIFNAIDPNASKVTVRIAGLSNEVKRVAKDGGGPAELADRVLELRYERPGDEHGILADTFKPLGSEWVKRRTALEAGEPTAK